MSSEQKTVNSTQKSFTEIEVNLVAFLTETKLCVLDLVSNTF